MKREYLEKYAKVMFWGLTTARESSGGSFKKNDIILLRFDRLAQGLAEAIHRILLEQGMNVIVEQNMPPGMSKNFYTFANDNQLIFNSPWMQKKASSLNGLISLGAPSSLTHLKGINPKKIITAQIASKKFRDILDKREAEGKFAWTLCSMPTGASAQKAKMTKKEYEKEIIKACHLDKKDPVGTWAKIYESSNEIKNWLLGLRIKSVHVESANIDLEVKIGKNRKWLGVSGHNIPSFEIFTSPDYRGTEGVYFANIPSFKGGGYIEEVKLVFRNGRVVEMSAKEGQEILEKQLSADKGACRLGEFSLTDKRFSPISKFMANTLFDENTGGKNGNCHVAVGSSFVETFDGDAKTLNKKRKKDLGFNDSAIHWDLINTKQKKVTAQLEGGGKVIIYEDGEFKN